MSTFKATYVYYKDNVWVIGSDVIINMQQVVSFQPYLQVDGKTVYTVATVIDNARHALKVISKYLDQQWENTL